MFFLHGIIGLLITIPYVVIAQTAPPTILYTLRYLPDVIKDDLIHILHLHQIAIVNHEIPQDDRFFDTCNEALKNMTKMGDILVSESSGFKRPENNEYVDEIFNITAAINATQEEVMEQKEVTQEKDIAVQYAILLNDTTLQRHLNAVINLTTRFSEDASTFVSRLICVVL